MLANSVAMYPPPTISRRSGSWGKATISFEVSASSKPGMSGSAGQVPVAAESSGRNVRPYNLWACQPTVARKSDAGRFEQAFINGIQARNFFVCCPVRYSVKGDALGLPAKTRRVAPCRSIFAGINVELFGA